MAVHAEAKAAGRSCPKKNGVVKLLAAPKHPTHKPKTVTHIANMASYHEIDIDAFEYGTEVNTNKNTGAKSVHVSTQAGSNSPEHKLRFQLGSYDAELMRAPFGVSKMMQGQENNTRRDLDLSIDSDEMLDFLRKLDERNLHAAVEHSQDWFKKNLDKAVLKDRFKTLVKDAAKIEFRPTVKTKLVVDAERGTNTQFFLVTKSTPSTGDSTGRVEEYVPATMADLQKGSKVIVIVETNGMWIGANQFGMSLNATHVLIWPNRQVQGIEAFAGLGAPRRVTETGGSRPTGGGFDDAEMIDM